MYYMYRYSPHIRQQAVLPARPNLQVFAMHRLLERRIPLCDFHDVFVRDLSFSGSVA